MRPKALTKQQFGKRVYDLLVEHDMSQSDLAKKAKLSRNIISTCVRGISYPSVKSLRAIAKVFKVDPDVLLPNHMHEAIDDDLPLFSIQVSPTEPDMAWLRINQMVMRDTAVAVQRLVWNDKAAEEIAQRRANKESNGGKS